MRHRACWSFLLLLALCPLARGQVTAEFSATPTAGTNPLTVTFTDLSTGAFGWDWDFGDGNTSTEQHPVHTYTAPGVYTVTLTALAIFQLDVEEKVDFIEVEAAPLDADFAGTPTAGSVPLTVQFENLSTGPVTGVVWEFGDGQVSFEDSPSHTYEAPGSYDVTLTALVGLQSDVETRPAFVTVEPVPFDIDFTADPVAGGSPLVVSFESTSIGAEPTSWSWDFGDGGSSSDPSPTHIYFTPGVYDVSLTGSYFGQEVTVTKPAFIEATFEQNTTQLMPLDPLPGAAFGSSVAIDGHRAVVGSSIADGVVERAGAVYVFEHTGARWVQQAKLVAADGQVDDRFGSSVDIDGDRIVVNAGNYDGPGAARGAIYVFTEVGGSWVQEDKVVPQEHLYYGQVRLSGDRFVLGSFDDDWLDIARAYVYVRQGGTWVEEAQLLNPIGGGGGFAESVDIDGDTVLVGAWWTSPPIQGGGVVHVFERDGSRWSLDTSFWSDSPELEFSVTSFGGAVALSGDVALVGAPFSGVNSAHVFRRQGREWVEEQVFVDQNPTSGARFGYAVAIDGPRLAITSLDVDPEPSVQRGSAYIYSQVATDWVLEDQVFATEQDDSFGRSAAVAGGWALFGAFDNNSLGDEAGAAYAVFHELPECYLLIGAQPGEASFLGSDHVFESSVGPEVEAAYPVLMTEIPEFVLPDVGFTASSAARGSSAAGGAVNLSPAWLADGQVAVQIVMWNPGVFPGMPEQFSAGLLVSVLPGGQVKAVPYGQPQGGLDVWAEVTTNEEGQKVLRFPFAIEGL